MVSILEYKLHRCNDETQCAHERVSVESVESALDSLSIIRRKQKIESRGYKDNLYTIIRLFTGRNVRRAERVI